MIISPRYAEGDISIAELEVTQIREQLSLAVDRVMGEGSCYDRDLAALAIKQSMGDLQESGISASSLSHNTAPLWHVPTHCHLGHGHSPPSVGGL